MVLLDQLEHLVHVVRQKDHIQEELQEQLQEGLQEELKKRLLKTILRRRLEIHLPVCQAVRNRSLLRCVAPSVKIFETVQMMTSFANSLRTPFLNLLNSLL